MRTDGQGEKEEEVYDGSEVSGLGNLTGAGPTHWEKDCREGVVLGGGEMIMDFSHIEYKVYLSEWWRFLVGSWQSRKTVIQQYESTCGSTENWSSVQWGTEDGLS